LNPRITKTQSQQQPRTAVVEVSPDLAALTPTEEKVIRMLHGLSEPDDAPLEFGIGASPDTMLNLALVEANNIVQLDGQVPVSAEHAVSARDAIDRLLAQYGAED
jgi:hypothetical protein